MSLSALTIASKDIPVGDVSIKVHALTIKDLSALVQSHGEVIGNLFQGEFDIITLLQEAPEVAATITALATKEVGDNLEEIALAMPMGAQIMALEAIWEMTVTDPKELMAVIKRLLSLMEVDSEKPQK